VSAASPGRSVPDADFEGLDPDIQAMFYGDDDAADR